MPSRARSLGRARRCASEVKLSGPFCGLRRGGSPVRALSLATHTRRLSTPPVNGMEGFACGIGEIGAPRGVSCLGDGRTANRATITRSHDTRGRAHVLIPARDTRHLIHAWRRQTPCMRGESESAHERAAAAHAAERTRKLKFRSAAPLAHERRRTSEQQPRLLSWPLSK